MPRDDAVAKFSSLLNEHGLFDQGSDASDYARMYFHEGLTARDADPPLKLWEVYSLKR